MNFKVCGWSAISQFWR